MIAIAPERAPNAVASHVQVPLGAESVSVAASGIVDLADETMANAACVHGVELGLDISIRSPGVWRRGRGLHGARIAEKPSIRRIVVPQNAGVGSAVGLLRSPVALEVALSVMEPIGVVDAKVLALRVEEALKTVRLVVGAAIAEERIETEVKAGLRYQGQGLDLTLPIALGSGLTAALERLEQDFVVRYRALLGFSLSEVAIELVSLRTCFTMM